MRNRNLLVLAAAVLVILIVAAVSLIPQAKRTADSQSAIAPETTQAADQVSPEETTKPLADAYLLVTVDGTLYEPIALYEESEYTIRRSNGSENVIHVTPDSVFMKSSTCDNQDCVLQGTVSLENKVKRVLGNMIICLPNEITLELYTPQELAAVLFAE